MEALGQGLASLGNAIGTAAGWAGAVCIALVIASSILIYTDKIKLQDLKDLFSKDKRWR